LDERLNQSGHVNKLENRVEQVELPSAFSPGVIKNYFDLQNHEPVNDFLGESKTQPPRVPQTQTAIETI